MFGAKKKTAGSRPDKVYKDVCSAFDSKDIKYNRDEEKFISSPGSATTLQIRIETLIWFQIV